ncbi:MAG: SAM-dependent methyltransferase [Akkermansiaceae bacterium]|nr:SAM-dependent methyltransferase [Akkermansiaceae bacterium]MCP5549995.1 SAM-dependent methyltransferase [Akkermansiaceae bacterium]
MPDTRRSAPVFHGVADGVPVTLSFADFMAAALYDPDHGYYADPDRQQTGRGGDFITSVSVGACFGGLLGREIARRWREDFGAADRFAIVEQGAHDGRLARDILEAIAGTPLARIVRYFIVEPAERRRRWLRESFDGNPPPIGDRARIVASPDEIREPAGVFLCNELLDAFPVHRVRFREGQWREIRVEVTAPGRFREVEAPIGAATSLLRETGELGHGFPEGYETELCLGVAPWALSVAPIFERGCWWIVDYGYEKEEYYRPDRRRGTLRCFRRHTAGEDPLEAVGETDLTAHVDFSRLRRAAESAGLVFEGLTEQHRFLTRAAGPWLLELERDGTARQPENAKRLRQFHTLTHPDLLGQAFKVAEFSRRA